MNFYFPIQYKALNLQLEKDQDLKKLKDYLTVKQSNNSISMNAHIYCCE